MLPIAQENKYREIFKGKLFSCCVYSLESAHRGDFNETLRMCRMM